MERDEINEYEEALNEAENAGEADAVHLPEPVKIETAVEEKVTKYIKGEAKTPDITSVTRDAAQRLNLGLLFENIRVVLELQRQRAKIEVLEKKIYSEDGVNADKELVALYNSERAHYMTQLEYVRKYVLNNKSAMDDLNKEPNEVLEMLTQLSGEKLSKLKSFIGELVSENSVDDDDLLEDK